MSPMSFQSTHVMIRACLHSDSSGWVDGRDVGAKFGRQASLAAADRLTARAARGALAVLEDRLMRARAGSARDPR